MSEKSIIHIETKLKQYFFRLAQKEINLEKKFVHLNRNLLLRAITHTNIRYVTKITRTKRLMKLK